MNAGYSLVCPIRGPLKVTGKSADGLTPSEEKYRVEAIKFLLELGYPKEHFIIEPVVQYLGNSGRNSLRADFAVLDCPATGGKGVEWILAHAVVLAEIKRDSKKADAAKANQVEPLLGFATRADCLALYWDDVNQLAFWQTWQDGIRQTIHAPAAAIPRQGDPAGVRRLKYEDLRTDSPIREVFQRVEDVLHSGGIGPNSRFDVMLQLLLAKIHDENGAKIANSDMIIQDYRSLDVSYSSALGIFTELLGQAVNYYSKHLPSSVSKKLQLPESTFSEAVALLAPHALTAASNSVVQDFYMYFAKGLYKWDLAQYFTPPPITQFIIDIIAPGWDGDVLDPACGSADFLTAAYRRGVRLSFPNYASKVWGTDNSKEAVQIAVLNMVLNGDGKSNIALGNSLETGTLKHGSWDVVVCNPPFGTRIRETSSKVLSGFGFGHDDFTDAGELLKNQQTGILFVELCVKLATPGAGRVALVLPNGYLGNTSAVYVQLRKFLLTHTRVAAVVSLPRFAFKASGADVSTSLVFLEKREEQLVDLKNSDDYPIAFQVVNDVGWTTGDKRGAAVYERDEETGALILDESLNPTLAADFKAVLVALRNSPAGERFAWLASDSSSDTTVDGHVIAANVIMSDPFLTLDGKKWCQKAIEVRTDIKGVPHFRLGDVASVVPELRDSNGGVVQLEGSKVYGYVELSGVDSGAYRAERMRGWKLPERGKHLAEAGDIYVATVWGSVRKWMLVGDSVEDTVVSNGMTRLRMKPGQEHLLLDLVAGICSEAYSVQMRSRARGSDGLAEIRDEDLLDVVLPEIHDEAARTVMEPFVKALQLGLTGVTDAFQKLNSEGHLSVQDPPARSSHVFLV